MTYEPHLQAAESSLWPLQQSVEWERIDVAAAARERRLHAALHDAALIEGYLPQYAGRMLELLGDDVDATAVLSIELFEGLRHYTALKRYLARVGYQPADETDARLRAARASARGRGEYSAERVVEHLTHFMGSELFAAFFFRRVREQSSEPVLRELLERISADEHRHAAGVADVLAAHVRRDPSSAERVLAAARAFRHYGEDVVDVPVGQENDFEALAAFNRRVRLVCDAATAEG